MGSTGQYWVILFFFTSPCLLHANRLCITWERHYWLHRPSDIYDPALKHKDFSLDLFTFLNIKCILILHSIFNFRFCYILYILVEFTVDTLVQKCDACDFFFYWHGPMARNHQWKVFVMLC